MLDDKDIEKMISAMEKVFPKKDELVSAMEKVFPTRIEMNNRFDDARQEISDIQTSVDAYAKKSNVYFQEMMALNSKVNRIEDSYAK